jgi:very-short-patch-repair endonuclease
MDTPLHAWARAHDGVVTRADAGTLGYDWPAFRSAIAAEGWNRLRSGAYVVPGRDVTLRTRVRAEQARRTALVASHRTAARLHGADVLTDAFEFLTEGSARYDVPGGRAARTTWSADDVVDLAGLRVTSPARTATDLLRAGPREEAVCAVDGLLRCDAVTLDAVAEHLRLLRTARYVARAWRWFPRLDPASGSVAESLARLRLWDAGLVPRTQAALAVRGRRVRVDFWFPAGVVVEIEGFAFHSSREQHQSDVLRFNALGTVPGITVLRFSRDDVVRRPAAMVTAVRAALRSRAVTLDSPTSGSGEFGSPYSPVTSEGRRRVAG